MSGHVSGVQTILRREYMPRALYIHCCAHRLNLVISDVCKVLVYISEFMAILSKIYSYFTTSGVTNEYFRQAQQDLKLSMLIVC
jgi:transposase